MQSLCNLLGDDDYILERPYSVEISAGQTTFPFNVSIINDSILEKNESFHIIIVSGSLPNRIHRGNIGSTRVTIVDNDGTCNYIMRNINMTSSFTCILLL